MDSAESPAAVGSRQTFGLGLPVSSTKARISGSASFGVFHPPIAKMIFLGAPASWVAPGASKATEKTANNLRDRFMHSSRLSVETGSRAPDLTPNCRAFDEPGRASGSAAEMKV